MKKRLANILTVVFVLTFATSLVHGDDAAMRAAKVDLKREMKIVAGEGRLALRDTKKEINAQQKILTNKDQDAIKELEKSLVVLEGLQGEVDKAGEREWDATLTRSRGAMDVVRQSIGNVKSEIR